MDLLSLSGIGLSYVPNMTSQSDLVSSLDNNDFSTVLDAQVRKISSSSIEEVLKEKYPLLSYHVCDASKFTYSYRLDFPFSELFKENIDENKLVNWRPTTPYATGYEDYVQRDRLSIPQGAYSVIIHPDVHKRMEADSEYAQIILNKIDKHFQDTIKINEAISPGCTIGMKQMVYIDENEEIGDQVSITNGPDYKAEENENNIDEVNDKLSQNEKYVPNQKMSNLVQGMVFHSIYHSTDYENLLYLAGFGIMPYIIDRKKE